MAKCSMTRSFNITPKTTEQHLIARSDKSVVYVTNNKRLFDVVLLKLTADRPKALRGLFVTAELLVCHIYRPHPHGITNAVLYTRCTNRPTYGSTLDAH